MGSINKIQQQQSIGQSQWNNTPAAPLMNQSLLSDSLNVNKFLTKVNLFQLG